MPVATRSTARTTGRRRAARTSARSPSGSALAWESYGEVSVSASTSRVGRYTARKIIISGFEKAVAVPVRAVN